MNIEQAKSEIITAIKDRDEIFLKLLSDLKEENNDKHDKIIKHQLETNGRVTKLENQTRVMRWAESHPVPAIIIAMLILAGTIYVGVLIGFDTLIKGLS